MISCAMQERTVQGDSKQNQAFYCELGIMYRYTAVSK